jgi:hypothetical protein
MMQTDIKSAHLNASGVVFGDRTRVRGYQIKPSGTAGQIDFYDNPSAASGNILLSIDTTNNTAVISTLIPSEGILFERGVYANLPAGHAITVFYG